MGCEIEVELEDNRVVSIRGARCRRGEEYAYEEVVDPKRVVMSVVRCVDGDIPTVSVKTSKPIPKKFIWDVMKVLATLEVRPPVEVGQILVKNILNLGVDIVATRPCRKKGVESASLH